MKKLIVTTKSGAHIPNKGLRQKGEGWLIPDEVDEATAQTYATNYPAWYKIVDDKPKKEAEPK